MLCNSYGHITPRRRTRGSSSLMCGTSSMRRTGQKCFGLYGMSGPTAHSLPFTYTITGPLVPDIPKHFCPVILIECVLHINEEEP